MLLFVDKNEQVGPNSGSATLKVQSESLWCILTLN